MLTYEGTLDQTVTNVNIVIHHAPFGTVLYDKNNALSIRCGVYTGKEVPGGGQRVSTIHFPKQQHRTDSENAYHGSWFNVTRRSI